MKTLVAKRPLHHSEKMYTSMIPCYINLAISIADPKIIPEYLEKILRCSPPFFMACDKDNLYRYNIPNIKIHQIPENIVNLEDSVSWAVKNCPASGSDPLATVAINSHKIVLTYSHSFFSGAMLMNVVKEIQNEGKYINEITTKLKSCASNLNDIISFYNKFINRHSLNSLTLNSREKFQKDGEFGSNIIFNKKRISLKENIQILNNISNKFPLFPMTLIDSHPQINKVEPISSHCQLPTLTHYRNVRVKNPDANDYLQMANSEFNIKEMKGCLTYNNKNEFKVNGLTEYLSACYIIAVKSFGQNIKDGWGMQTAYDSLRTFENINNRNNQKENEDKFFKNLRYGQKYFNLYELTNHVGNIMMTPIDDTNIYNETVGNLMSKLRSRLNEEISEGKWQNHMKWCFDGNIEERERLGLSLYLSNIGQVRIKYPIRDVMMRVSQEDPPNVLNMITYSVISESENKHVKGGKNEDNRVKTHLVYGREEIAKKEVEKINESVAFAIRNLSRDMKIQNAIQMIKEFRENKVF